MRSLRRIQVGIAVAALGLGVGALLAVISGQHNIHRGAYAALALGIGWGFIGTGLYAWRRRPASNIGPLMIAVGFAGLLKALAFSGDSVIFTIGSLGEVLIYAERADREDGTVVGEGEHFARAHQPRCQVSGPVLLPGRRVQAYSPVP